MGKKKRILFSPKFEALRSRKGKFSKLIKEHNIKMKFLSRTKRKALEEKLATLEKFSDEAKEIRGKLGWGEPSTPAPPAPEPIVVAPKPVVEAPAPPAPKTKVGKAPVKKATPVNKKAPAKKKATTKKSASNKKK